MEFPLSKSELLALPGSYQTLFDLCHFLLAALAVRKEVGVDFTRSRPFATWLATLSASFAGSLVANPLLGKPILGAISSERNLMMATVLWWAVCYSPADIVYNLATNKAAYIPVCVLKEIYRAKKIVGGIGDASKVFPDHELAMVLIGTIKGNGSGVIKPVTRLLCGVWKPSSSEILEMSVTTKECLCASILLVLDQTGYLPPPISGSLLYLAIVATFLLVKISSALGEPIDPFTPLEKIGSSLALGGLWDQSRVEKVE
jgi:hypothetical protein